MAEIRALFGSLAAGQDTIPDVIKELEEVLEAARKGEVRSIAMTYIDGGDCTQSRIIRGDKLFSQLSGAVAMLQYDILKRWDQV